MEENEIKLLEEMKENCIKRANYVDVKAMQKYNLLRHIEDLETERKEAIRLIKETCFDGTQYCVDLKEIDVKKLLAILEEKEVNK